MTVIYRDWFASSQTWHEHMGMTNQAIADFLANHPSQVLDITRAQEEWCLRQGFPADYLLQGKHHGAILTAEKATHTLNIEIVMPCPVCGAAMEFDVPPQCPQVNPEHYTGLFTCSKDDCTEHFYTIEGLIDIINKIRAGQSEMVQRVRGII